VSALDRHRSAVLTSIILSPAGTPHSGPVASSVSSLRLSGTLCARYGSQTLPADSAREVRTHLLRRVTFLHARRREPVSPQKKPCPGQDLFLEAGPALRSYFTYAYISWSFSAGLYLHGAVRGLRPQNQRSYSIFRLWHDCGSLSGGVPGDWAGHHWAAPCRPLLPARLALAMKAFLRAWLQGGDAVTATAVAGLGAGFFTFSQVASGRYRRFCRQHAGVVSAQSTWAARSRSRHRLAHALIPHISAGAPSDRNRLEFSPHRMVLVSLKRDWLTRTAGGEPGRPNVNKPMQRPVSLPARPSRRRLLPRMSDCPGSFSVATCDRVWPSD